MELRDNKRKGWDVKGSKIRDEVVLLMQRVRGSAGK